MNVKEICVHILYTKPQTLTQTQTLTHAHKVICLRSPKIKILYRIS